VGVRFALIGIGGDEDGLNALTESTVRELEEILEKPFSPAFQIKAVV
jgi:hypothetical protein